MTSWYLTFLGLVLILLEGVLLFELGFISWSVQLGIVLTVFLALNRSIGNACVTLMCWLLPLEWAASGRFGFYSLGVVAVFFLARIFQSRFEKQWGIVHVVLVLCATALHHLIVALLVLMTTPSSPLLSATVVTLPKSLVVTAVVTWPLGHLLLKLEQRLNKKLNDSQLIIG